MKRFANRFSSRLLFSGLLILLFLVTLAGCGKEKGKAPVGGEKGAAGNTIRIGVAGAHSGDLASYGLPTVKAAELVVKDINAKGGILGKKVELIVEDDVCKPEMAANTAAKLVSAKVDAVIGHICSGATKAAIGIYKDAGIVAISPSATNPELTQSGQYPNFFRTIAPDDAQAKMEVDFAINRLNARRIAILHDKGDYGKGLAEYAKKFVETSGTAQVVLFEGVTPGAVDYSAVVQKIKGANADAVIYGGYHPEASSIVMQMRKKGMKTPFLSDDGVKDITFIKVAGSFAEGVYATGPRDTSANPLTIAATEAHKKAYGSDPGAFFLNAYAATQALLHAIEKAGSPDYEKVKAALRSQEVETPLGKIHFDEKGEAVGVGFAMYQVKNGVFSEVK
ncbi:branched-chain amino acid transport system substrate-binding protein [Syntrophus gentianae]|uniref:Branched-chain amino acid transport system substrate-binding protein n=1 Tax=Syntrophus gentianae TaxID=43775 RepID=A0A1H7YA24_9BACT|nr:branched-chain amino acid ABC transporter substrate-binding protein [Syntrophus gentianae]SEM42980.1 branched-chain amino acid transport system substrate-binding protein [Syntrophus gentianae]